ncbi:ABC-type transport system, involved in lipoprotein release, permease component [Halobacteroides halobius DSM 5150]|uniref:ABC-type transport system, involved in lipoprotein release, permease component n=1 Tax=Halobacteroides halobius (strain ATCC 35273 / DSM 5150 / MD-1) TaxID=748449 RepID=L0K968_HALHC|nr:FtsX-like permease family protein [Halobacteroides halobius]AGB40894.1 ABC-type transport system, involved in lipoprotein release, permease component [Halobacteroides halobius DSM 5150]
MFLVKLALKNLTRHQRRVLITASIIALGIAIFLIYDSIQIGMNKLSFNNIRNLETGHLQVINKKYWSKRDQLPLKHLISQKQQLKSTITDLAHFKAVTPKLKFSANLNNGINQLPVIACGIAPKTYQQVFTIEEYLVAGRMIKKDKYQVIMGQKLAGLMDFKVGDYLTLLFKTKTGTFNTISAKITGLFHTNNPEINNNLVYIPLGIAQQALNLEGQITQLVVRLDQDGIAKKISKELERKLITKDNQLTVHPWRDFAGEVIAMSKAETAEKTTIMFLILIIAAVGIVNTILLSSLERIKEIGMMKALGLRVKEIVIVFVLEAMGIGLIGGILGSLLGSIIILYFNIYGINLSTFVSDLGDWGLPVMGQLYAYWNPSAFILVISFGVVVSLIASILPAFWAARKDPVEAIAGDYN